MQIDAYLPWLTAMAAAVEMEHARPMPMGAGAMHTPLSAGFCTSANQPAAGSFVAAMRVARGEVINLAEERARRSSTGR
jgi:hypothetical protein